MFHSKQQIKYWINALQCSISALTIKWNLCQHQILACYNKMGVNIYVHIVIIIRPHIVYIIILLWNHNHFLYNLCCIARRNSYRNWIFSSLKTWSGYVNLWKFRCGLTLFLVNSPSMEILLRDVSPKETFTLPNE